MPTKTVGNMVPTNTLAWTTFAAMDVFSKMFLVGALLGDNEGTDVVGAKDGLETVGVCEGFFVVGDRVGTDVVGDLDGRDVTGDPLGTFVGARLGTDELGAREGDRLGAEVVGPRDGEPVVGEAVGVMYTHAHSMDSSVLHGCRPWYTQPVPMTKELPYAPNGCVPSNVPTAHCPQFCVLPVSPDQNARFVGNVCISPFAQRDVQDGATRASSSYTGTVAWKDELVPGTGARVGVPGKESPEYASIANVWVQVNPFVYAEAAHVFVVTERLPRLPFT